MLLSKVSSDFLFDMIVHMAESKDWKKWHTLYDNNESGQAKRLRLVQESIGDSLPNSLKEEYQIIDICSGDGRDLLDVLAHYPHKDRTQSYLVELDEKLAKESRERASDKGLRNVIVFNGDASFLNVYKNIPPADLLLLCGVFGNISDTDIRTTIELLPQLSKKGTKIIWTRHLRQPHAVRIIQNLFIASNFSEIDFKITDDRSYAIATYEFVGSPKPLNEDAQLFTFIK